MKKSNDSKDGSLIYKNYEVMNMHYFPVINPSSLKGVVEVMSQNNQQ